MGPSVNVVCAVQPDVCPEATSVKVTPRSSVTGLNWRLENAPLESAVAVTMSTSRISGSSNSNIVTVSPGSQPWPLMITGSPGT